MANEKLTLKQVEALLFSPDSRNHELAWTILSQQLSLEELRAEFEAWGWDSLIAMLQNDLARSALLPLVGYHQNLHGLSRIASIQTPQQLKKVFFILLRLFDITSLSYWARTDLPQGLKRLTKITRIHCALKTQRQLPEDIAQLPKLAELSIPHSRLESLPAELGRHCPELSALILPHNALRTLPDALQHTRIAALNLENNLLTAIPAWLERFPLYNLRLQRNKLQQLPAIGLSPKLVLLHLSHNQLTEIPRGFLSGENLMHLIINNNRLTALPLSRETGNFPQLERLCASRNQIQEIPTAYQLPKLVLLNLSHNQLREIPTAILHDKIRVLGLNHNPALRLPQPFALPAAIKAVHLSKIPLQTLPIAPKNGQCKDAIFRGCGLKTIELAETGWENQPELRCLDLSNNPIESLPEEIRAWKKLRVLRLSHTNLRTLPENLAELTELREIDLRGCRLEALPDTIHALKQLKTLHASGNQLVKTPANIGIKGLEILDLSNNKIDIFPEFAQCKQLRSLRRICLAHNQIAHIPENIRELPSLQHLDLSHNQLETLPEWLEEYLLQTNFRTSKLWPHLAWLDLRGNPFWEKWTNSQKKQLKERLWLWSNRPHVSDKPNRCGLLLG